MVAPTFRQWQHISFIDCFALPDNKNFNVYKNVRHLKTVIIPQPKLHIFKDVLKKLNSDRFKNVWINCFGNHIVFPAKQLVT